MITLHECIPCFRKMALRDARLACPNDVERQNQIVGAWENKVEDLDLSVPPPVIARHLADLIYSMTGRNDLFSKDKRLANIRVLELLPRLRERIIMEKEWIGGDPFALALEFAIIGNFIDLGVDLDIDWEMELGNASVTMSNGLLSEFMQLASAGNSVLILGDNTGEIVLDMLLVEVLQSRGCEVTYAVRSHPIINDATLEDAEFVGMTHLCPVIESGVDTPGTVIDRCSPEFIELMQQVDVILSKGQGNFESLEGVWPDIFCAFKVKCHRVAGETGLPFGSSVFCKTSLSSSCEDESIGAS